MAYAVERGYGYRTLNPRDIYVDSENQTSIVNVFRPPTSMPRDQAADVQALFELLAPYAPQGKARSMLHDLSLQSHDWAALAAAMHDIRDDLSERSLINRAKDEDIAVAEAPARPWLLVGIGVVVLGIVLWLGLLSGGSTPTPEVAVKSEMVLIPKGPFIYQKGEKAGTKADFWISKHEVTVAQYAEFLDALKKDGSSAAYDDPKQPGSKKSHEPEGWAAFYSAASTNGSLNNQQVSLNAPVSNVDYWDAVAYAKWRKQRLPTEKEWEKAARGTDGRDFPWGSDSKPGAANLGNDYVPQGKGGQIDGFNFWSPVDKPATDESPYHVIGMAGNVQEWTASWETDPDYPLKRVPVLRGGHFGVPISDSLLTSRHFPASPDEATPARGFRTVSDSPP
jgi:formylglycine-generating enzyme required for sulfatase activity